MKQWRGILAATPRIHNIPLFWISYCPHFQQLYILYHQVATCFCFCVSQFLVRTAMQTPERFKLHHRQKRQPLPYSIKSRNFLIVSPTGCKFSLIAVGHTCLTVSRLPYAQLPINWSRYAITFWIQWWIVEWASWNWMFWNVGYSFLLICSNQFLIKNRTRLEKLWDQKLSAGKSFYLCFDV